jgi:hypothetical protein
VRFIAEGPSIPDDLLSARDDGRVVFFCGSGVSRARASLPDFFGLADMVVRSLGITEDNPACRLIREAYEIEERVGIPGIISADRIFSLLEREFAQEHIESAVANALRPAENCDITAHKTLLDLATTSEGDVRLVTTNFDRLFEEDGRNLQIWQPPRLPTPSLVSEMNGIIYLHGRANRNYDGAENGFILSSSEFGRTYLSEGWATSFIREILQRHVVVFVGYSADDPPVQYLLEAINKVSGRTGSAYAFQAGGANDAAARWDHKGVEAIWYSPDNKHSALWDTLERWAERARNPDLWYRNTIICGGHGPASLAAFERGHVAHIVSTVEGAKKFAESADLPPAEWLCVFDSIRRFANPGYIGSFWDLGDYVDPFDLYGLDSDFTPEKIAPDDHSANREIPDGAWDVFALNRLDRNLPDDSNFAGVRGYWAEHMPRLPPRLRWIGLWIAKVSNQPAAVWWAARQTNLHPDIQQQIQWAIETSNEPYLPQIRQAWDYLFDAWKSKTSSKERYAYQFAKSVKKNEWNATSIRTYAALRKPHLSVETAFENNTIPISDVTDLTAGQIVRRSVAYPPAPRNNHIPDDWLARIIRVLRSNLELAVQLEEEVGGHNLVDISPLCTEDKIANARETIDDLNSSVIEFKSLFARLGAFDRDAAFTEYRAWPSHEQTVFMRLRIWAAANPQIVPDLDFSALILEIGDVAFWDFRYQTDLLSTLQSRWDTLSSSTRQKVETRILAGPALIDGEEDDVFQHRRAANILDRLYWLHTKGCSFSFELDAAASPLREAAPEWNLSQASKASDLVSVQAGFVQTLKDHSEIDHLPINKILSAAQKISGRTSDFLVENDPFAGLISARPKKAFLALANAAKGKNYPEWAWRKFLDDDRRTNDDERLVAATYARLIESPDDTIVSLIRPISQWMLSVAPKLSSSDSSAFDSLFQRVTNIIDLRPSISGSAVIRGKNPPDWVMEAINSPVGKLAQVLFKDPRHDNLTRETGFPQAWLRHVESLLLLTNDARRYALVLFSHNLNWFFFINSTWTDDKLLAALEGEDTQDRDAALAGILWSSRVPGVELYLRLKPSLLSFARQSFPSRHSHRETLSGIILAGWGSVDDSNHQRIVSNEEMRELLLGSDEELRLRILWQVRRWARDESDTRWRDLIPEFIEKVWPRQTSVRSAAISAELLDLVFSNEKWFPYAARTVATLLSKVNNKNLIGSLVEPPAEILAKHPNDVLALLDASLPDNAADWPYGIDAIVTRIGEISSDVRRDRRFQKLRRIWNAR